MTRSKIQAASQDSPAKVAISLLNKDYLVTCDPGQEYRLQEIARFVNERLEHVASRAPANTTETRLFMLTCLMLADELMEVLQQTRQNAREQEDLMVAAVDHLRQRIATIANQVGTA
jgi:cell division protein ZapA